MRDGDGVVRCGMLVSGAGTPVRVGLASGSVCGSKVAVVVSGLGCG